VISTGLPQTNAGDATRGQVGTVRDALRFVGRAAGQSQSSEPRPKRKGR
jgi:hypothetical protein